jgi:hypothetical protein
VTYERIVDLNEEDTTEGRASRISPSEILPKSPPKHDITEEELKYCFRRLTLTAPAPPTSESVKVTPDDHLDRAAEDVMAGVALEKLWSNMAAISEHASNTAQLEQSFRGIADQVKVRGRKDPFVAIPSAFPAQNLGSLPIDAKGQGLQSSGPAEWVRKAIDFMTDSLLTSPQEWLTMSL